MAAKPLPVIPPSPDGRSASPSLMGVHTPRDELARYLSPLVAVTASARAEAICQSNHISSFTEFIRPFGDIIEGRVSPRDWQGTPIAIDNFNVRFRSVDKLDEPNHQAVMALVDELVKARGASMDGFPQIKCPADVNDAYLDMGLDDMMPWYTDFKKAMLTLRGITEHETFDHPVACFIVISSDDPDPMGTITQLYNPNIPSFTVDKPYVDPNVLRYYVLLHDPHLASEEQAVTTFEKMRKTLGLHCHLLRVNSRRRPTVSTDLLGSTDEGAEAVVPDPAIQEIWQKHMAESAFIESRLQAYSNNQTASTKYVNSVSTTPGHTRSSSVSSNLSSLPGTAVNATALQTMPLELSSTSLDNPSADQSAKPSPGLNIIEGGEAPQMSYGRYMMPEDIEGIKMMMREFVVQSLIPFMERNIQHWNEQVASARRGLTGRLFGASRRLFGSTTRSNSAQSMQTIPASGPNVPPGVSQLTVYPYTAPEAQMRKLADYAFMIRDYKFAHTIYDTVRRDYATDKAYKYHAGTQEMLGICLLMMNQPSRTKLDADRNFELAVQQYLGRCRSPFHATRTTVMYYELLKIHRMWKEVPTALVRMTGEDSDLRSALFLEQAAHCFLRTPRPMVRKYGFHVVMAAHRYSKAQQRQHAFRCYRLASLIFEGRQWSVAKSHIYFALGRQSYHLGKLEDAAAYFANVLADSKQTPQQQIAHIREFLFIYQQYTSQADIDPLKESLPNLALPVIEDKHIRVSLTNAQLNTDNQEEWARMERELLEENIAKGFIYGSKKALALQQQDDNRVICAIGEPAIVHVEMYNPLQVAIKLNHVILGCQHRESMKPSKEQRNLEAEAYEPMVEGKRVEGSDMHDFGEFETQMIDELTLEPLERRTVNLALIPRREGSILIKGIHYTFGNLVHTFRPIHKKGKRLNNTLEQRRSVCYAPDYTLDILVTSPMPLLDLTFHGVPETILSGEVVQTVLEINNKGNKGLTALRVKSSHPSFFCIGNPEEMDKEVYAASTEDDCEKFSFDNKVYDPSVVSVPLPASENGSSPSGVVNPGKTTLVPLWIRGDRIGKHAFKFLFSYQSEEDNAAIAHRTVRYTINLQVLPSLKINAFTRPSAASTNEYILGIEIENLQTVAGFQLTQLTTASPLWTIIPLSIQMNSSQDIQAKTSIPPRQTTFVYYKIRKLKDASPAQPVNSESDAQVNPVELNITKLAFGGKAIPFDATPLRVFALNSRTQWRRTNIRNQYPHVMSDEYDKLFGLYNPGDVDLTLYWDIPNMKRHGHHYIIGINLADVTALPALRPSSITGQQPRVASLPVSGKS